MGKNKIIGLMNNNNNFLKRLIKLKLFIIIFHLIKNFYPE